MFSFTSCVLLPKSIAKFLANSLTVPDISPNTALNLLLVSSKSLAALIATAPIPSKGVVTPNVSFLPTSSKSLLADFINF